jgi:protein-serine/threonine kinase
MAHPFFADVDWNQLAQKNVVPPFKPKLKSELDVSNFDPEFTNAMNQGGSLNARAAALASGINPASTPLSPTVQANFEGFTFVDESAMDKHFAGRSNDLSLVSTREEREDDDWERVEKGDRMSGVMHPHDSEEGIFSRFDD